MPNVVKFNYLINWSWELSLNKTNVYIVVFNIRSFKIIKKCTPFIWLFRLYENVDFIGGKLFKNKSPNVMLSTKFRLSFHD